MICPFCKAENAKSCVTPGPTSSTCMAHTTGHYGEDGEWVRDRDPNWHTTGYSCSRGHRFTVMRREGDADVVKLASTLTTTDSDSTSVVLAFESSRSSPTPKADA